MPRWHPRGLNNRLIVGATFSGVSRLPTWLTYRIGHVGTWLAFHLQRQGTQALIENARVIFPELGRRELRRLALLTYRSYARDTIDFIRSLSMPPEAIVALVGRLDTRAFDDALVQGQGAVAVSPHFGNWEIGGVLLKRLTDHPLTVVAMKEPSAEVTRLRQRIRASLDIDTLEVGGAFDTALRIRRVLQQNHVVALLIDRHLGKDRVPVVFFGRRAYFLRTPALLAYLAGAPLVPSFIYRGDDDRLIVECGPVIHVAREGSRDENVQRATQAVAHVFEGKIRARPHYWYQFYPFWSTQSAEG